jgi:hypothetical protein
MPPATTRERSKFLPIVCPATALAGVMRSLGATHCTGGSATGKAVAVACDEAVGECADGAEWFGGDEVSQETPSDGWLAPQDCRERQVTSKLSSRGHEPRRCLDIVASERVVVEIDPLPRCAGRKIRKKSAQSLDPETAKCAVTIEYEHLILLGRRNACRCHRTMLTHDAVCWSWGLCAAYDCVPVFVRGNTATCAHNLHERHRYATFGSTVLTGE